MLSISPLRYPGGKTRFSKFIWESIISSGESVKVFAEPFCGGAGAAISLLESKQVEHIALNDLDPLVSSFWKVTFGKSSKTKRDINWLIRNIETAEISVNEWRRLKASKPKSVREAAWKCLYLNRTSFNGILHKAGPIGGWDQKKRSLDVRFNREKLAKRLRQLYELGDQVERTDCMNWKAFCSLYEKTSQAYIYLDPPYYHRAEQLYGYLFDEGLHCAMRDYLVSLSTPWILSYDDALEVRELYSGLMGIDGRIVDQTYSTHPMGGASFVGRELVFSNRKFPAIDISEKSKPHVGLSIIGELKTANSLVVGPMRTPTAQNISLKK